MLEPPAGQVLPCPCGDELGGFHSFSTYEAPWCTPGPRQAQGLSGEDTDCRPWLH